ncbi:MAG: Rne/Rng family ribonuclease [Prevotellaceae bacterium]|nr:Rne/Rng family ribonuclease [Prevotellaceae bacterium]
MASSGISIALLDNKKIVELTKDSNNERFSVADIYLGRVRKIMPALNAAFIDIGHDKDAFIHYLDLGYHFQSFNTFILQNTSGGKTLAFLKAKMMPPLEKEGKITTFLKQGQPIMVQIVKEAISTKGPRLTSEISIAGRNLVLIPFSDKISISQKIVSNEEKKRLRRLIKSLLPSNYGIIVRTVAEGKSEEILADELNLLIKRWEDCCNKLRVFKKPELLIREINRTSAILRDMLNGSFDNIYVNNKAVFEDIKEYVHNIEPQKDQIVKFYRGKVPIFDQYGVSKQIKGLFGRVVSLRNGAYMIIEHTEALHVIDVNSGIRMKSGNSQEAHALEVNMLAAEEIARQLRLRDMGGIIVVDFIDMRESESKHALYHKMIEFMEIDRAKHNILPLSKFGLMQMTRQRVRPETHLSTKETCPTCHGTGHIGSSLIFDTQLKNQIAYFVREKKCKSLIVTVHPFVAAFLKRGFPSLRMKWSFEYRCYIKIIADSSLNYLESKIYNRNGVKLS